MLIAAAIRSVYTGPMRRLGSIAETHIGRTDYFATEATFYGNLAWKRWQSTRNCHELFFAYERADSNLTAAETSLDSVPKRSAAYDKLARKIEHARNRVVVVRDTIRHKCLIGKPPEHFHEMYEGR